MTIFVNCAFLKCQLIIIIIITVIISGSHVYKVECDIPVDTKLHAISCTDTDNQTHNKEKIHRKSQKQHIEKLTQAEQKT